MGYSPYKIKNQEFWILPEKCIFRLHDRSLILADLHLGKAGHFRKNGIPIPKDVHFRDLSALEKAVNKYQAKRLLILGDLYHSEENLEWLDLTDLVERMPSVSILLVAGNHDKWGLKSLPKAIALHEGFLEENGVIFSHEPMPPAEIPPGYFNISGHLHPGVIMRGKGMQTVRLPCFWVKKRRMVLPAFSSFTGKAIISPSPKDHVFVVTGSGVMKVHQQSLT